MDLWFAIRATLLVEKKIHEQKKIFNTLLLILVQPITARKISKIFQSKAGPAFEKKITFKVADAL